MPQSKSPFHDPKFININGKLLWGNVRSIQIVVKTVFFQLTFKWFRSESKWNYFIKYMFWNDLHFNRLSIWYVQQLNIVLIGEQTLTSASNFFYLYSRILLNFKKKCFGKKVVLQIRNLSLCVSVISFDYS